MPAPAYVVLVGLALLFSTTVLVDRLRIGGLSTRILAGGVLLYVQILVVTTVLSWPGWIARDPLLGAHLLIAGACLVWWWRAGRPALLPELRTTWRRFGHVARRERILPLLLCAALGAAAVNVLLIALVPPNNWDSMTCHLARAAYWMQFHRVADFFSHNPLHNDYPNGASVLFMYALLFIRSDALAGFVQFGAWLITGVGVYRLARELRFARGRSLVAALITLLLPQCLLQATSTQIDLLFAATIVVATVFLLRYLRRRRTGELLLAGLAVGLVFATKGMAPLFGPFFALLALGVARACGGAWWRPVLAYGVVCTIAVGTLGSEAYVRNWIKYRSLTTPGHVTPRSQRVDPEQIRASLVRSVVVSCDIPLARRMTLEVDQRKIRWARWLGKLVHVDVDDTDGRRTIPLEGCYYRLIDEDSTWFGLVGLFVLPAAVIVGLFRSRVRPTPAAGVFVGLAALAAAGAATIWSLPAAAIIAAAALFYVFVRPARAGCAPTARWLLAFLVLAELLIGLALFEFAQWVGRYLLPQAVLAGALLPLLLPPRKRAASIVLTLIAILASVQALEVLLNNGRKPLVPSPIVQRVFDSPGASGGMASILQISREQRRHLVRPDAVRLAQALNAIEPPVRRLGILSAGGGMWDFVYFGPDLQRELVVLKAHRNWWKAAAVKDLEYIVSSGVGVPQRSGYVRIAGNRHIQLLKRVRPESQPASQGN